MIKTACPLDCYDACAITCDPDNPTKLKATTSHPTSNGALCAILNKHMFETPRIQKPRVNGVEVSMDDALDATAKALQEENPLLWRGSGHLGLMQGVTDLLIDKLKGSTTYGSLCDGAGQAGIKEGRGYNRQLPPEQIAKADVVVVWGRNLTVTNSHIMPFIKGKKIIVIDPVATPIAKKADLHIQLRPRSDFHLAIMLSRLIFMDGAEDEAWLDEHASEYEDFYEFTQDFRMIPALEQIGIGYDDMISLVEHLVGNKVVFLLGAGPQKYSTGHYVFWAIDSLAATLGLFGKEGCGVSYLGESRQGFENPFAIESQKVSIVTTAFHKHNTVLVQGGNPAGSMPDSTSVVESLQKVSNLIYFGLYENETSTLANIIIPAKTFLEKDDIRTSYGHHYIEDMNRAIDSSIGISEYEFTREIFARLGLKDLKSQEEYLDIWKSQYSSANDYAVLPDYHETPYEDGFGEHSKDEFVFIDDYDDDFENPHSTQPDEYWLLSPKPANSLNTQFGRGDTVSLPSSLGFATGDKVKVISEHGEHEFVVKNSDDLRDDCIVIVAGSVGLNLLTPPLASVEGEGACYQEVKVRVENL